MPSEIKKKFINAPDDCVPDALKGLVASDDSISFHPHNGRVIIRKDVDQLRGQKRVALVTGGGSGHEPFAAGFVGSNGLTAAVCGDIFASPPSSHVSDAVSAVSSPAGTIVFVINYTGDRLHFGMAIERLKAKQTSANLEMVHVDDDVALESKSGGVGRRGLAGAAICFHIIGVLVENNGLEFSKALETSKKLIGNLGTFGVSLYPCAIPGKSFMFELSETDMELGLGIHGETGLERRRIGNAKEVINFVLEKLVQSTRLQLKKEHKIVVLLNNLGAVSQIELGIVQGEILDWLVSRGFQVERFIVGFLMTSLDGHGLSVTILKLEEQKWLECLDVESAISRHWKMTKPSLIAVRVPEFKTSARSSEEVGGVEVDQATSEIIQSCVLKACDVLIEKEGELNRLDASCGDGDCGSSLKSAAKAIQRASASSELSFSRPKALLLELSIIFEESVGGTSGALYALMLGAASKCFEKTATSDNFKAGLKMALEAVIHYGHAKPGHRTLVDPLSAAVNHKGVDWSGVLEAVEKAAKETTKMEARSGRASYTSKEHQQEPDPGAQAFAFWFRAIHDHFYRK